MIHTAGELAALGELAAFMASVALTVTALCFDVAAKRIGSLTLNVLRLTLATVMFALTCLIIRGELIPFSAGLETWFWLGLSGLAAYFLGDLFFFQAYVDIGARLTQMVLAVLPLMSAVLGFFVLGERISFRGLLGMFLVVGSIVLVVANPRKGQKAARQDKTEAPPATVNPRRRRGILCAVLAAAGQAVGFIFSKLGMTSIDPLGATQIRIMSGLAGFLVLIILTGKFRKCFSAFRDLNTLKFMVAGSFFGPFLGGLLSLVGMQRTSAGIASTLISLVPIMILLPERLIHKKPVSIWEAAGAIGAVAGSALIFL